ncbi:MAG: RsmB/NOP family class I SAM-dependent RNA methyltransferase [Sphingomonas sp.]|uniref:RsmB/NOP family class I SAM-dependent RNA methyltransferase n=1 Tax=Sphingomonas sp. TaxID=28214 RepID=UPI0025F3AA10|nr:RsmB/NOP family class I SAM-dependent RNA methyltransferase [Sphingomonas sp.]MBY0283282.1 RsmB/NOP family class I SAM-dependent RNA methyltransferase [Sphingomonas sp.]
MQEGPKDGLGAGVATRLAALKLLDAVLRRGQPLEAGLPGATRGIPRADDRALVHAITAEVLRRLGDLDALIDSATQRPLPDDAKARMALRIALAQALALGTPGHAAISTVLPLVDGGPRKLVHGVFGTLMRKGVTLPALPSLPPATAERWHQAWGDDMLVQAARALAKPPALDLTLADPTETEAMAASLGGVSLMPGHLRLAERGAVPDIEGYGEGRWWVQDLAASLPARLIGRGEGHVIDLCAAPGGKTLQLAAAGWQVTAIDIAKSRVARLRDNLARTGLKADVVTADAFDWKPTAPADALLLDAPCSATGIFRRHPDVLHRVRAPLIAEMAELQARLLARAADWVRPGGYLVYATCSLEPEEGEEQIGRFLADRLDYAIDRVLPDELPHGLVAAQQGWLRTLPGTLADVGGCDGFFIARMMRIA